MSAVENKPATTTVEPSPFETVKSAVGEALTAAYGTFTAALSSYTIACVDFGAELNSGLDKWVAAGAKRAAFFPFAGQICGGKSRTTLEQYMDAALTFDGLPEEWRKAGQTAQIVEMATLASVSDKDIRVQILEDARNPEVTVTQTDTEGVEQPVTDTEKRVRILANQYKDSQMTPEQLEASEAKRTKDQQAAMGRLVDALKDDVLKSYKRIGKDLTDGKIDVNTAIGRALAQGARIGQEKAAKGGPNAALAVSRVFSDAAKPADPEGDS